MKVINLEAGKGKTKSLILHSSKTGHNILCEGNRGISYILSMSERMGVKIPEPITYDDFMARKYLGRSISGICIDDIERFLTYAIQFPISAITSTKEREGGEVPVFEHNDSLLVGDACKGRSFYKKQLGD